MQEDFSAKMLQGSEIQSTVDYLVFTFPENIVMI